MQQGFFRDNQGNWQSELLADQACEHGFGTRESVEWPPAEMATLRQTHSADVWRADRVAGEAGVRCLGEGDALVTDEAGYWVSVRTADCTPILLASVRGQQGSAGARAVAAVHAGWRGTAGRVVQAAVRRLEQEYGCAPSALVAAIGPAIGPCCYEVGAEVAELLPATARASATKADKWWIDVAEENRRQLLACGVPEAQIATARMCTSCLAEQFWSFRRDKSEGRMVSAIRPR